MISLRRLGQVVELLVRLCVCDPAVILQVTDLPTYLLHGAESFLRSWPVFAASQEIPCIFMEPEGSLPYSQVLATRPYPELTPSRPHDSPNFLKIHLNIILPPTSGSPQWPLSLRFPYQHPVHPSLLLHSRHMPRPSHSSRFDHPHNTG